MDTSPLPHFLIRIPVAPMHRDPDPLSEQVSQALLGMSVALLEEAPGWSRIRTPDGYEGWTEATLLAETPSGWAPPWAEIEDLWANLRARPDYQQAAVMPAMIGSRLPLLDADDQWVRLLSPDGTTLYTEARRVRLPDRTPPRPPVPREVCRTARRFLGVPYLWGGCSPLGLDCSGFVQLVLRLHGIEIQRDASQQARQGSPIAEPDAGDLVFFGPEDRPERLTHVGMMLDARRFIHAYGSDRVRIDPLREGILARQYRFARRFPLRRSATRARP